MTISMAYNNFINTEPRQCIFRHSNLKLSTQNFNLWTGDVNNTNTFQWLRCYLNTYQVCKIKQLCNWCILEAFASSSHYYYASLVFWTIFIHGPVYSWIFIMMINIKLQCCPNLLTPTWHESKQTPFEKYSAKSASKYYLKPLPLIIIHVTSNKCNVMQHQTRPIYSPWMVWCLP